MARKRIREIDHGEQIKVSFDPFGRVFVRWISKVMTIVLMILKVLIVMCEYALPNEKIRTAEEDRKRDSACLSGSAGTHDALVLMLTTCKCKDHDERDACVLACVKNKVVFIKKCNVVSRHCYIVYVMHATIIIEENNGAIIGLCCMITSIHQPDSRHHASGF